MVKKVKLSKVAVKKPGVRKMELNEVHEEMSEVHEEVNEVHEEEIN